MNSNGEDSREACKYGAGCYQKNPLHKDKFKHPQSEQGAEDKENIETKKRPLSEDSSADEVDDAKKSKLSSSEEVTKVPEEKIADNGEEEKETEKKTDETETEYMDLLPASPENIRENIKQKFLVEMPEDFFQFYDFCKGLNKEDPSSALSPAGLKLCGAYDVIGGKIPKDCPRSASLYLRHYRYYYDPPEFQTVITTTDTKEDSGLPHIGYFRDNPKEKPVFVASNTVKEGGKIVPLAENIFGAVYQYIAKRMTEVDPFTRTKLAGLQEKVKLFSNRLIINSDANGLSLDAKTPSMKLRDRKKVSTTFHGAGLVVPYDKNTEVGYREIPETTTSLKKIFRNVVQAETEEEKNKALDVLQELVTNVQFANDEGDPGMGLELGLDAFTFGGSALHNTIRHLLGVGYDLLDRDEFGTILTAHLDNRVTGAQVDMFNN